MRPVSLNSLPRCNVLASMRRFLALYVAFSLLCVWPASAPAQGVGIGRFGIRVPGQNPAASASPFDLAIARGDQALRRGEYALATQQFEAAQRLDPRDARPAFYLGEVELRQAHWATAEGYFRAALRLNPRMAEAHADLGTALREQGRTADAMTEMRVAIQLDPTLAEAHFGLAMMLEDAGQRDAAIGEYRNAVRLAPNDPMPALNLGILLASGRPAPGTQARAEAFRMLQAAVRNANNERAVLVAAGPALRLLGEHSLAVQVLERARTQGTPSAPLLAELAQALFAAGNTPLALQRIGEAVQLEPQRGEYHYVRGLMLGQLGRHAEARAEMQATLRLGTDGPLAERARQALAQLQRMQGAPSAGPDGGARP